MNIAQGEFVLASVILVEEGARSGTDVPSDLLGFDVTTVDASADMHGFTNTMNSGDVLLAVDGNGIRKQIFCQRVPCW
jgi:hypothetical protein